MIARGGAVGGTEVPSVVHEPRVLELLDRAARPGGLEPVGQRGTPTGGVDHEVGEDLLPRVVRTPVTCGTPRTAWAPATRPLTATPRRTVRPGVATAAAAMTASTTGRRAVTAVKSSSPGRDPARHLHRGTRRWG